MLVGFPRDIGFSGLINYQSTSDTNLMNPHYPVKRGSTRSGNGKYGGQGENKEACNKAGLFESTRILKLLSAVK
jgi:hypothetical protein